MKAKKFFAAALSLLLMLSLLPGAWAAENLQFLRESFAGMNGISLRDMIDENRGDIEIAGSSFQLQNLLFLEECVVDEDLELCVCETTENAVILDDTALPEGCHVELRNEPVRIPDAKDGLQVAEEIRLEKAGRTPEPKEEEIDPADRDRETWYLYLVGRPSRVGNSLFVLWDGNIRLVNVEVLAEKPAHEESTVPVYEPAVTEAPVVTEEWVEDNYDPFSHPTEPTVPAQEWTDTDIPMTLPTEQPWPTEPPAPAFVLPTPTVVVTGDATVQQGGSALLEAQAGNTYNAAYQWYAWDAAQGQWTPVNGATGSQYRPDTSVAGISAYLCRVTNYGDTGESAYTDSEYVTLTVEAKPAQPELPNLPTPSVTVAGSTKVSQGETAILEVSATDAYNASYQWYENSQPIAGATASQYRPDTSKAGTQTYIVGVTSSAYGQTATAFSDPVTVTVEAKPTLPTPTVTLAGNSQAAVGDSVLLEARVQNGYNLKYQWFTSLGYYDAPLQTADASSAQFRPDTSKAGTYTYFCRVTSSGYGEEITVDSAPMTFTVSQRAAVTPTPNVNKTVSSVSVAKLPNKVDYNDGDAVDATGLQLRVRYADGSYDVVDSGYLVMTNTVSYNNSGLADVYVNYRGYQTSYQVKVHSLTELIRGIGVLTMPNKTSYSVGDWLDTAGLSIRVYSYDGRYLDVGEGFECSPTRLNSAGNQTITVSFGGKTCTFTVAVQQPRQVYGLVVQSQPANRSYTVGETINTAGLVLQLQTSNGTETVTSGYTIAPRVATTAGAQQITVNYQGLSTSFTVNVADNIPRPTPTPTPLPYGVTPSPAPYGASPSPAPFGTVSPSPALFGTVSPSPAVSPNVSPAHTPVPARKNTGVSTLVKVLFVVAVLALGGLIGYVLYLRSQDDGSGDDFTEPSLSDKLHSFFSKSGKNGKDK